MRWFSLSKWLLWGGVLGCVAQAQAAPQTADEIRACVRANLPQKTSVQTIELTAEDREGGTRKLKTLLYWKSMGDGLSRIMLNIKAPSDLAGSSYLVVEKASGEDDMYVYLPSVQRTRRIVGQSKTQPLWNTDFSYEDIKQMQGVSVNGQLTRDADGKVQDRPAYVLLFKPNDPQTSAYQEVKAYIDQATCVPLSIEFYEPGMKLRKQLEIDAATMTQQDTRWQPQQITMRDLVNNTKTTVSIRDQKYDEAVSEQAFNPLSFFRATGR